MSGLRIVIPSHKRHDRVFAKYLVNDPIICVAKSQADLYKQFNPDCEIVAVAGFDAKAESLGIALSDGSKRKKD